MVSINYAFREISCKIVYYGPGLSGKTTNLQHVHDRLPKKSRGDLISLATEADRTLYFDFLPLEIGEIGGFATKFQMYTVPGQVFYNATRKLVLRGVDGIVFVADSQKTKMDDNLESLADMQDNLKSYNIDIATMPIVIQYNKRDLPDICTIEELEAALNKNGWPYVEASAVNGRGVFDTMKKISKIVLADLRRRTAADGNVAAAAGDAAPVPTGTPPSGIPVAAPAAALMSAGASPSGGSVAEATLVKPSDESYNVSELVPKEGGDPEAEMRNPNSIAKRTPAEDKRPTVIAAQRSTRVRRRKRSLFDRMFGWLFGR